MLDQMDDDEFDDLLAEVEMITDSQAESLTTPPMDKIKKIFEGVADALNGKRDYLSIQMKTRPRSQRVHLEAGEARMSAARGQKHELRFPGSTANESKRFSTSISAHAACPHLH